MYANNTAELEFVSAYLGYQSTDVKVELPSDKQEIYEHWDVMLDERTYDIKGLKKKNRSDKHTDADVVWIELMNVRGNLGWLYGKADYIVFEQEEYFAVISRNILRKMVETKLISSYSDLKKPYWIYRRKNRLDQLTLIPFSDIKHLIEHRIPKISI